MTQVCLWGGGRREAIEIGMIAGLHGIGLLVLRALRRLRGASDRGESENGRSEEECPEQERTDDGAAERVGHFGGPPAGIGIDLLAQLVADHPGDGLDGRQGLVGDSGVVHLAAPWG